MHNMKGTGDMQKGDGGDMECEIQFRFAQGKGKSDAIFTPRQLMEKHREVQKKLRKAIVRLP